MEGFVLISFVSLATVFACLIISIGISYWLKSNAIVIAIVVALAIAIAILVYIAIYINQKKNGKKEFFTNFFQTMIVTGVAIAVFVPILAGFGCEVVTLRHTTRNTTVIHEIVYENGIPAITNNNGSISFLIEENGVKTRVNAAPYTVWHYEDVESAQYCLVQDIIDEEYRFLVKNKIAKEHNILILPKEYESTVF